MLRMCNCVTPFATLLHAANQRHAHSRPTSDVIARVSLYATALFAACTMYVFNAAAKTTFRACKSFLFISALYCLFVYPRFAPAPLFHCHLFHSYLSILVSSFLAHAVSIHRSISFYPLFYKFIPTFFGSF